MEYSYTYKSYKDFQQSDFKAELKKTHDSELYMNNIVCFDIEVSTAYYFNRKWQSFDYSKPSEFYADIPKTSWSYIWHMSIDTCVYWGRTLEEFKIFLDTLQKIYNCKIYVWVHNLSYEMQFLRNVLEITGVFARKRLKPMKFNHQNVTFRCSYIYSNLSLAAIGNRYNKVYKKMDGDLDYNIIRFPDTELTEKETQYCINDVLVMYEYLSAERKIYRNQIPLMPLTSTGKMRKELKKAFKGDFDYNRWCRRCVPTMKEYKILNTCFQGGYTHANSLYVSTNDIEVNEVFDMHSKDLTSSYPTVCLYAKLPKTNFTRTLRHPKDIDTNKERYICFVELRNVQCKMFFPYIAYHKCEEVKNCKVDNGRIYKAEFLSMWVTDVDMEIIQNTYDCDIEVIYTYTAKCGYLDDRIRNLILRYYEEKTKYKGIAEYETEYELSKTYINAIYGTMVTNYIAPEVGFCDDWTIDELTDELIIKLLNEQRQSKSNLLLYSNGLWITAEARKNLFYALSRINVDAVYCDTDSVKYYGNYEHVFNEYNKQIVEKLKNALSSDQFEKTHPNDNNGIAHQIGIFVNDGEYESFVTYGAKKYAYIDKKDKKVHVTVSGLNKKTAINQIHTLKDFRLSTVFSYENSGRTVAYYQDNQPQYDDGVHKIQYQYGIVLQPTTYTLGIAPIYERFCNENNLEFEEIPKWEL